MCAFWSIFVSPAHRTPDCLLTFAGCLVWAVLLGLIASGGWLHTQVEVMQKKFEISGQPQDLALIAFAIAKLTGQLIGFWVAPISSKCIAGQTCPSMPCPHKSHQSAAFFLLNFICEQNIRNSGRGQALEDRIAHYHLGHCMMDVMDTGWVCKQPQNYFAMRWKPSSLHTNTKQS